MSGTPDDAASPVAPELGSALPQRVLARGAAADGAGAGVGAGAGADALVARPVLGASSSDEQLLLRLRRLRRRSVLRASVPPSCARVARLAAFISFFMRFFSFLAAFFAFFAAFRLLICFARACAMPRGVSQRRACKRRTRSAARTACRMACMRMGFARILSRAAFSRSLMATRGSSVRRLNDSLAAVVFESHSEPGLLAAASASSFTSLFAAAPVSLYSLPRRYSSALG